MGKGDSPGRPPDKSDEEIVATVKALIETTDSPAIERKVIQEELGYSEQAMRDRLRSLVDDGRIGRYDASGAHIFWVPKDQDTGGEADSPEIITNIDSIKSEDISTEKAREFASAKLPDYQPRTIYRSVHDIGDKLLRWGMVVFSVGIMLLLTQTALSDFIPSVAQAQVVLVGFGLVAFGGLLQAASFLGEKLSERGVEFLP
ncbi:hypothetical protein SG26_19050 (plasmid) [Haloarcula sp. CBA1115]|uniref:hypothetical protein n=1 Tax=unclassified Haloarcula TaxID=2624677 RepID=UPI00059555CD|nr:MULTISPECIES: hypothetical protein [unclassified Haloarcula]AJF27870.1 hypothetical protein SG26_19050 [Haloarcula sp. CBA1115]